MKNDMTISDWVFTVATIVAICAWAYVAGRIVP